VIVRGGWIVTGRGVERADIAVAEGRITAVDRDLDEDGEEIDAGGLHVFPGGIDSHVHLNEPGRSDWETIADGSAALAAGGYTAFIDMPLNNLPVTIDGDAFDLKLVAMRESALVDFGLWGGLVPGNLDRLEDLHRRGVLGFKAFMCPSGIEEFPACNRNVLHEAMHRIAELDSILLVHAEDQEIIERHTEKARGAGPLDFAASRPPEAEVDAIFRVIELSAETGCRLHVVHVSTAEGARLIREAQERGVDVSGETCPHYLLYVEEDLVRLGGIGKCAPPFRQASDRDALWDLSMVVSDHSPSTIELKEGGDFFKIWGGISGCQTTRLLLLAQDRLDLARIAEITATNIAARFRLEHKGDIAPGFDADLWVVDLDSDDVLRREDLLYRNRFSAHEGQRIRGATVRTLVRGEEPHGGRFIPGPGLAARS
jgi:allantoinase